MFLILHDLLHIIFIKKSIKIFINTVFTDEQMDIFNNNNNGTVGIEGLCKLIL